jgi:hypothetical protein
VCIIDLKKVAVPWATMTTPSKQMKIKMDVKAGNLIWGKNTGKIFENKILR